MGTTSFPQVDARANLEDVKEILAEISQLLDFLLNGNIDFKNVRAKSISADRMNVKELSAITANLGHITAGLIEAVKIISSTIIGSYIATAEGSYPRVELSSVNNFISALQTASNYLTISPNESGSPRLIFNNGTVSGYLYAVNGTLLLNTANQTGDIQISSGKNVRITANRTNGYKTYVDSWGDLVNNDNSQTLQQALNAKLNTNGVGGVFYVSSSPGGPADKAVQVVNGQIIGIS